MNKREKTLKASCLFQSCLVAAMSFSPCHGVTPLLMDNYGTGIFGYSTVNTDCANDQGGSHAAMISWTIDAVFIGTLEFKSSSDLMARPDDAHSVNDDQIEHTLTSAEGAVYKRFAFTIN